MKSMWLLVILGVVVIASVLFIWWRAETVDSGATIPHEQVFTGTIQSIDPTFQSMVVDGKRVILGDLLGDYDKPWGSVIGFGVAGHPLVPGNLQQSSVYGDFTQYIGKRVEAYAAEEYTGGFTLLGKAEYYVKLLDTAE